MNRALLAAPRVAWPTLAVLAGAVATWAVGLACAHADWPLAVALCTVSAYVAFTPLHEAAHRVIARRRWVNEACGRIASVPLTGPFLAVRYLHLEHHKHTNDPDLDPDHFCGRGPRWLLPLRWLAQDLHYYVVYLRRPRARRERLEVMLTFAVLAAATVVLVVRGYGREVTCWLVSARLAIGVLTFAFDYLPHRPHRVTARQDRHAATNAFPGRIRYVLSLGQSLHLVHHLYPGVPFYRYARLYLEPPCTSTSSGSSCAPT
jgi:fatty acid desaturase